ncbi:MAG: HAD-IA family hydrolase [Candidatus Bathyarchaeia archaeon]
MAWDAAEKKFDFQELTTLLDEFWVQLNSYVLTHLNVLSDRRELAEFITTRWWDFSEVALYSDARTVLPALKEKGLKMGVVTNGLQSDVAQILPKIGLQNFFNVVVVINTLERMKPDVAVFRYALQRLKVPASRTVFVGDEVEADYMGSQKAGVTAYLIDQERTSASGLRLISSLIDLIECNLV